MNKLKIQRTNWHQIARYLVAASKRLATARKILSIDEEACFQQTYDAMLKASLGFMLSFGLRPRSQPGHHVAIIQFVASHLDKQHQGLIAAFDRMRRKRNQALYDASGLITRHEAKQALEVAEHFLSILRDDLQKRGPKAPS